MSIRIENLQNLPLVSIPVGNTGSATSTSTSTSTSTTQIPKANPFDMTAYAAPQAVQLPDGTSIQLPSLSSSEQEQVSSLFGNFSGEQMSTIQSASQKLAQAIYSMIANSPQPAQTSSSQMSIGSDDDDDDDDDGDDEGTLQASTPQMVSSQMPLQSLPVSALPTGGESNTMSSQTANAASSSNNPVVLNTLNRLASIPQTNTQATAATGVVATGTGTGTGAGTQQNGSSGLSSTASEAPTASIASPTVSQAVTNAATAYNSAQSASGSGAGSYDTTVQGVTYMGVLGLQTDLQNYAQYIQGQLNNQNTVRGELSSVTQALADWPAGQQTQNFTYTTFDQYGNPTTQTQSLTQQEAGALQQNLQDQLDSMSDQNQLGQLQLQQMSQNYEQGVSTISNLLKMNYDTVKSIVNNVKSS